MHFAVQIAVGGLLKSVSGPDEPVKQAEKLITGLWIDAQDHAYRAVSALVAEYLWDRFGRS